MQKLRGAKVPGPKVLVVCGHPDADLASEVAHVTRYSQALQEAFGSHVMAYVSDASTQVGRTRLCFSLANAACNLCSSASACTAGTFGKALLQCSH